jgi:hypothetical protein
MTESTRRRFEKHAEWTLHRSRARGSSDGATRLRSLCKLRRVQVRRSASAPPDHRHGTACVLEGLSQTFPALMSDCAFSGSSQREKISFHQINKKTGYSPLTSSSFLVKLSDTPSLFKAKYSKFTASFARVFQNGTQIASFWKDRRSECAGLAGRARNERRP